MLTAKRINARELFLAALDIGDSHERRSWLEQACAGDASLLSRIDRLLAADRHGRLNTRRPTTALLEMLPALDPWQHLAGSQVGAYRIESELGRGGMGAVFRAIRIDGQLEQQVAIKFLRRDLVDANALRRFRLEREVISHLQHPGIVRILDAAQMPDGTPYYVMEYVDGAPVLSWCDDHALTLTARLRLFLEICDAINTAHRNLIVHRDLKSGNILVDASGHPRLLDFGIAKALGGHLASLAPEDTATAQRFFSPATAAPEQLRSGPVTVACDVYALGMLLYELLSGMRPFEFEGLSAGQIEERILRSAPPTPSAAMHAPTLVPGEVEALARRLAVRGLESASQLARQLRGDLDAIVMRCLRKTPMDRYASVEALASDVNRYLDGRAVQARDGARWYVFRKFVQRHRRAVAATLLAAFVVIAAAAGFARQAQLVARERDRAEQVTGLLVQAFRSADPGNSLGADITAREILDRSAQEVAGELDAAPELRAELMGTLAEVNVNLYRHAEARSLLDQAQHILDDSAVSNDALRGRIAAARGRSAVISGDAAAASRYLDEALALAATPELRDQIALDRIRIEQDAGRYEWALAQLDALLRGWMASAAAPRSRVVEARLLRADLLRVLGRPQDALIDLQQSLDWFATFRPPTHPDVIKGRMRLAELQRGTGNPQAALEILQASRESVTRLYGAQTPIVAALYNYEGNALDDLHRVDAAVAAYREAHRIWAATLGEAHPNVARVSFNLAQTLHEAAADAEADVWFRRTLEVAHRAWPGNHPSVVLFSRIYASFLVEKKREADALAVLVACLDVTIGGDRILNKGDLRGIALAVELAAKSRDAALVARYGKALLDELGSRNLLKESDFTAALAAYAASGDARESIDPSRRVAADPRRPSTGEPSR
ncbi:MAG: protein kinase [Tahibacter sp.]